MHSIYRFINIYRFFNFRIFLRVLLFAAFLLIFSSCLPPEASQQGQENMTPVQFIFSTVWFFLLAIFVYFMLVRKPEIDRETAQDKYVESLKKGEQVVTGGGIIGKVVALKDDSVTVEIANNVKVKVLSSSLKEYKKLISDKSADNQSGNKKKSESILALDRKNIKRGQTGKR